MKILELKAADVGALADGAYSFADARGEPARLSAITGSAASGKSTLLEAIIAAKETIGPYGGLSFRFNALRRAGAEAAKLDSRWRLSGPEQAAAETPERDIVAATSIADAARLAPDCSPQIRSLFSDDAPAPAGGGLAWFPATRMLVNDRRPPPPMPALWLTRDNRRFESLVLDAATAIQADILASAEAAREHGLFPGAARGVLSDVREALLPFRRDKALQGVRVGDGSAELLFHRSCRAGHDAGAPRRFGGKGGHLHGGAPRAARPSWRRRHRRAGALHIHHVRPRALPRGGGRARARRAGDRRDELARDRRGG